MSRFIEGLDRFQVLSAVTNIPVRVIFENDHVILTSKMGDLFSSLQREGPARGIVECWNNIDDLGVVISYLLFKVFRYHSVLIHFHSNTSGLEHFKYLHAVDKCG